MAHNSNVNQTIPPNEDAKSLVFDDTNLFETTKFSGYDRLETGIRANVGVQYTFQSPVGHARVLAGQSYQLDGHNAYADPARVDPTDPNSAVRVLAGERSREHAFRLHSGRVLGSDGFVPPHLAEPLQRERSVAGARRRDRPRELWSAVGAGDLHLHGALAVRHPGTDEEAQQDILGSIGLRLTNRWSVHGAIRYDLDADETLTDSIQLAYLDECFMLSATYSETFITDEDQGIEPDRTVMLRFELKHLGGFNYQTSSINFGGGEDGSVPTIANPQ